MSRTLPEWIGKTDDQVPPARVRLRVFDREKGICHKCGKPILIGERWTLEHLKALINGGENREANLGLTCCNCLPAKNAADVAEKSAVYKSRAKHLGLKKSSRPIPGSRTSKWKKKLNGDVVRR